MEIVLAVLLLMIVISLVLLWEWGDGWRRRYYALLRDICPDLD
jgi:hypothetical protein